MTSPIEHTFSMHAIHNSIKAYQFFAITWHPPLGMGIVPAICKCFGVYLRVSVITPMRKAEVGYYLSNIGQTNSKMKFFVWA